MRCENIQRNEVYAPSSQYNPDEFALTINENKEIIPGELLDSDSLFEEVKYTGCI